MTRITRTRILRCLLTLSALLAGGSAQAQEGDEAAQAVRVSTSALSQVLEKPQYSAPASVVSLNQTQLSAQLNAQISDIRVRPGDVVKQGQRLISLDCSDAQLALESADAQQELAQKEYNRISALRRSSAVTEQQLNNAETTLRQARVTRKQAALQTSRCHVNAPFDGVVSERQASLGALAAPGTPLLTLVDLSRIEVAAQISAGDRNSLSEAAELLFDDGQRQYPVTLRTLSPVINPASLASEARLTFSAAAAPPGASGRLYWKGATAQIPADLLLQRAGQSGVFIADDDIARFVPLPGARPGRPAATELPAATQLIIDGRFGLKDGDRIEVQGLQ
ncbi:efflux RND transporter periplasmic adaptor subunit [Granulosicoccaceae sp. 1_MG-2023]|nr:efflux RND transporter periplasmic adaptor subunit [Granulosicoccaceae sp. 1_MG-2023]